MRIIIYVLFSLLLLCECAEPKKAEVQEVPAEQTVKTTNQMKEKHPAYIDLNFVMGKFEPKKHAQFINISEDYADTQDRWMHKDAYEAFKKMHKKASSEDVNFVIKSAVRNFDYQKSIWDRKWTGKTLLEGKTNAATEIDNDKDRVEAIMRFSSMPGTSRHHWGTDIDLNNFTNAYFEKGSGQKEYDWLVKHANDFGYYQVYTNKKNGRTGYEEEKWHWSYMPVAKHCIDLVRKEMNNEHISGFDGYKVAAQIDVVKKYILGIDKKCLDYGIN